ncbi:hypothetical protein C8F01DRAFT_1255765 [Mycena amicta]|nr:hypothetical protein C8F01DRAFT_1255765 [Mycena amicta]
MRLRVTRRASPPPTLAFFAFWTPSAWDEPADLTSSTSATSLMYGRDSGMLETDPASESLPAKSLPANAPLLHLPSDNHHLSRGPPLSCLMRPTLAFVRHAGGVGRSHVIWETSLRP